MTYPMMAYPTEASAPRRATYPCGVLPGSSGARRHRLEVITIEPCGGTRLDQKRDDSEMRRVGAAQSPTSRRALGKMRAESGK